MPSRVPLCAIKCDEVPSRVVLHARKHDDVNPYGFLSVDNTWSSAMSSAGKWAEVPSRCLIRRNYVQIKTNASMIHQSTLSLLSWLNPQSTPDQVWAHSHPPASQLTCKDYFLLQFFIPVHPAICASFCQFCLRFWVSVSLFPFPVFFFDILFLPFILIHFDGGGVWCMSPWAVNWASHP